jgi:hypothetical protein
MALPSIDFATIAATAKAALQTYGSPAEFILQGQSSGRTVRAVVYSDGAGTGGVSQLIGDVDGSNATAILDPDDFAPPHAFPKKFDLIRTSIGGFTRTYSIERPSPILAADTLPLILCRLKAN